LIRKRFAAALGAAVLVAVSGGLVVAQERAAPGVEKKSPGSWPDRTFRWYYNGRHHPEWLSEGEARAWVREAAQKWEACGVKMQYEGETASAPLHRDGRNVVGWREDMPRGVPPGTRGITAGPAAHGVLIERDIAFNAGREEFHGHPRLLKKVLVHEFGHAIGLTHSTACNDVMTLAASCRRADPETLPLFPTPHDLERCKALYPGTPKP
jgi:hypothetical protein